MRGALGIREQYHEGWKPRGLELEFTGAEVWSSDDAGQGDDRGFHRECPHSGWDSVAGRRKDSTQPNAPCALGRMVSPEIETLRERVQGRRGKSPCPEALYKTCMPDSQPDHCSMFTFILIALSGFMCLSGLSVTPCVQNHGGACQTLKAIAHKYEQN